MLIFRVLIAIFLFTLPAKAQERDIQMVISDQVYAFLKDDFASAYSFAAPSIQQVFPTPEQFGVMVKNGYPMIHKPAAFEFKVFKEEAGVFYQNVLFQDQSGRFFLAEYTMIEIENNWKIKAVRLLDQTALGA